MSSKEKILKNIIKTGTFATLLIPFIVSDSLYFPFITGKNFTFRIIIEILFFIWVWLALTNKKYLPQKSKLLVVVSVFFGIILLATIFSIDPYKSFWSNAERMEGFFGLLHVFLLFIIAASTFNKKDWIQFLSFSTVVSIGVALQGLFQGLGVIETNRGNRADAEFGNSTYLAVYNIFHFFFALYLISRVGARQYVPLAKNRETLFRWGLAAVAILNLVVLWFTNTRGAILGLIVGLFLATLLASFLTQKGPVKKWSRVGLVVVILVPILFFTFRSTNFVRETPVLGRFASISLTEQTTESRLTIWGMTIEAWGDRPILGWGMGNFTTVFAQYYEPKLWRQEPWFDRPHNVSLQWLVDTGIAGFIAYHILFIFALFMIWKLYRRNDLSAPQASLFTGLLVAYFIHNFFVFDNIVSYILFFSILGYLHTRRVFISDDTKSLPDPSYHSSAWLRPAIVVVVGVATALSLYSFNIKPIKAAGSLLNGLRYFSQGDVGSIHSSFKETIDYNTFVTTEAREQLGNRIGGIASTGNDEAVNNLAVYAIDQLEKQVKDHPRDMRARTFLASLYLQTGFTNEALSLTQEIIELAPTRQLFYFLYGESLRVNGDIGAAIEAFKRAYELDPTYPRAIANYGSALLASGRDEEAKKVFATQFGGDDPDAWELIASAYTRDRDYESAAQFVEKIIKIRPDDVQQRINLAQLYVFSFQDEKAIEQFEIIAELNPELKPRTEFVIEQIRAGTIDRTP